MTQLGMLSSMAAAEPSVMPQVEPSASVGKVPEAPVKNPVVGQDAAYKAMSSKEREGVLKQLNKTLEAFDTHVSLSVDQKSHQTVIRVLDNESGKVLRQIPSEQLLRISQRITELLGVIYDEKM
jgi:flagellar protein FlaG